MTTRSFNAAASNAIKNENALVRRVEAKIVQGPVSQRAALGELGNRQVIKSNVGILKSNVTAATGAVPKKHSFTRPPFSKNKPQTTFSGLPIPKENVAIVQRPKERDEEKMEVDEVDDESTHGFSSGRFNVEDIDAKDSSNPQLVSEYVKDIYQYLWHLESTNIVHHRYLDGQQVTGRMRGVLIDWMIQVHVRFGLLPETLYLTVAIVDRFLQRERGIHRKQLQLVGVTSMLVAAKFEEMFTPEIGDFAFITDKAYTTQEIRAMEVKILKTLDFNVSLALPLHFLRRNSKAGAVDAAQHTLAKYLLELCLPEYGMAHCKPSVIAAAALCLSLKLLSEDYQWTDTLTYYTRYTEEQLLSVVCKMALLVRRSADSKLQAVRTKYRSSKLMRISELPQLKSKMISDMADSVEKDSSRQTAKRPLDVSSTCA